MIPSDVLFLALVGGAIGGWMRHISWIVKTQITSSSLSLSSAGRKTERSRRRYRMALMMALGAATALALAQLTHLSLASEWVTMQSILAGSLAPSLVQLLGGRRLVQFFD